MKSYHTYTVDWDKAAQVLASVPQVIAAWGFGSAQSGRMRADSDLDLGVLFVAQPTLDTLADLRASLQQALQFDQIDLVVLNNATPVVRFEAVCGRLIFCRNAAQRAAFVSLTAREYEESMAMVQRALAARTSHGALSTYSVGT